MEASPFLLQATLQNHFEQLGAEFGDTVRALKENTTELSSQLGADDVEKDMKT